MIVKNVYFSLFTIMSVDPLLINAFVFPDLNEAINFRKLPKYIVLYRRGLTSSNRALINFSPSLLHGRDPLGPRRPGHSLSRIESSVHFLVRIDSHCVQLCSKVLSIGQFLIMQSVSFWQIKKLPFGK